MLRRVLVPALAASLVLALSPATSAARTGGRRVVLVTVDGTSIEDWTRAGVFSSLGAKGLLATRTATDTDDPVLLRAAAYTALGASGAADLRSTAARIDAGRSVLAGALGEALARAGLLATALGDASGRDVRDGPAPRAVMRTDGSIMFPPRDAQLPATDGAPTSKEDPTAPAGFRTDYAAMSAALDRALSWATVVVVDLGDAARADRTFVDRPASREPWITNALRRADAFVRVQRDRLGPDDTVIVASLVPPRARTDDGVQVAAVAMRGAAGTLTSGTTRRGGVVTLTDLAPTILERVGVAIPDDMQGRAVRIEPGGERNELNELDAAFVRARSARRALTRIWLTAAAALSLIAFLTIAAGRGRGSGQERIPRRLRDLVATGLVAAAAAPAAMLVAPALPGSSVAALGWWTLAIAIGSAIVARAALSPAGAIAAVALADVALVVGDLLAGTPLAARSPLGFQVAGGGRFYGIDEGLLGVALAGAAIATAAWLDGRRRPRLPILAAVPLAIVAVAAAAPAFGSKFGAGFTLVPAFGVFLVLAFGRRIDRVAMIGIAIATVLLTGSLAAADALSEPASRSHIGREIAGQTEVGALVVRKLTSFLEITVNTIWLPVSILIAVPILVFVWRRRNLLARGFWGTPARRAALIGVGVGCVAAMASNDTGIIVVAPALVVSAAAFYGPLLAPPAAVAARVRPSKPGAHTPNPSPTPEG
ncbi:MAG: hypothetical protein ACRDJ1_04065 [Actinomycetota bacterium]